MNQNLSLYTIFKDLTFAGCDKKDKPSLFRKKIASAVNILYSVLFSNSYFDIFFFFLILFSL